MPRLAWLAALLLLSACGGGKSGPAMSVVCTGGVQLAGATSIDVLGDVIDGRPMLSFPDPANPGKTGSISVEPRGRCRITPQVPS